MNKPTDYETAQAAGDYETLEAEAYKCKILKAEECKAINDKEYIKVFFDIAEGDKTDFYKKKYQADTRENKKWSGIMVIFTLDFNNKTNRYFKGLITCVEASNEGFKFNWDDVNCLKDKKIGIVLREEEFETADGEIKVAVKPFRACEYNKTEEAKIPGIKTLPEKEEAFDSFATAQINSDDDLPF